MQGKIIKGIAGFYYIYAENDEIYECKAKGIFRKDKQKPLVGDNVEIEVLDEQEKEGSVTAILPRKNSLIRPAVANVDQAFVIFAMENPKPNFMLLDRFLIMMEKENVPAVICFNKKDLAKQEELELLYETYKSCGYDVIFSSTFNGEGLDEIREILKGKTTVVAGPSGVGKSSITNALQENVQMETGEISKKLKRGKHTTRHSQVIPVPLNRSSAPPWIYTKVVCLRLSADSSFIISLAFCFVKNFFILFLSSFFICISNSDIISCLQFPVNTFFIFFSTLFNQISVVCQKNPPHSEADLSYHYFLFASSIILHFFTYFLRHLRYRYNILIFNAPISE